MREGDSSGTVTDFGSIDLQAVRSALATYVVPPDAGGPTFAAGAPNPFQHEFTVQLEVNGQGIPTTGIDRRVLTRSPTRRSRPGFPKRLGTGGESPTRYADLNGDNGQELIVPTEDGTVHAYEPNGSELQGLAGAHRNPGRRRSATAARPALAALGLPREPPRGPVDRRPAGNGEPDVIVAAGTHIYAWHANGKPVPGFPVASNPASAGPRSRTTRATQVRLPRRARASRTSKASRKRPDIVEPSLDGHLYAWKSNGKPVPGFPVALVDPAEAAAGHAMIAESINEPAIGDLNGDGPRRRRRRQQRGLRRRRTAKT